MKILLLVVLIASVYAYDKVLFKDVKSLTLHKGQYTNARRVSAIPQLTCTGGPASSQSYKINTVQCTNT